MAYHHLTERELATILAALRLWQNDKLWLTPERAHDQRIDELMLIATADFRLNHLDEREIDALSEKLHAGERSCRP